jgi:hypothetical protein
MNNVYILYPAIAMFTLSVGCIFTLGLARFLAIHRREVSIGYFSTYNKGKQPARLHVMARHVQNHFEVPPLFYAAVIALFVTNAVSLSSVVIAWLFVASRIVHTFIHLGHNNVSQRFFVFGFGLMCLCGLWGSLLLALLQGAN